MRKIERVDEQPRVQGFPPGPGSQKSSQLGLNLPSLLCGLFLERAERVEIALRLKDRFDRGCAEGTDQLDLQVRLADVEAELLHVSAIQGGAEAGPFECAPEVLLVARVAQACEPDLGRARSRELEVPADALRAADRHDADAFGIEASASTQRERFERTLVAHALDEDDRSDIVGSSEHRVIQPCT
ncbi:MAG TPA: hypothetical protein VIG35_07645 [Gaiellaceae bacterium]